MPDLGSLGAVMGGIVDEAGKPIPYATAYVKHASDSSMVTGGLSDENGRLLIKDIPWGTYYLEITSMAYASKIIPSFTLSESNKHYFARKITLEHLATNIEGAQVAAKKEMLQQNLDKKVYNLENSIITEGQTAIEALEEIPSVDVDLDGNVSVRGTSNVTILVDGRPTNLTLDQIPADQIESIEVITNPSARLEPDGLGGIINVVMKKNRVKGFNGMFNVSGSGAMLKNNPYLNSGGAGANLNFSHKKINLYLNYHYRVGRWRSEGDLTRKSWFSEDSIVTPFDTSFLAQSNTRDMIWQGHNLRAGLDYYINDKNTLSFAFGYNRSSNTDTNMLSSETNKYIGEELTPNFVYSKNGAGGRYSNNYTGSINYKKEFKVEGMELIADAHYSENEGNSHSRFLQDILLPEEAPHYFQRTNTDSRNRRATAQIDFVTPVGNGGRIETGYKFSYRHIWQDYSLFYGNDYASEIRDTMQDNNFKFDEYINALYFIYSNTFWEKFKVQLGLRGEFAQTRSELLSHDQEYEKDYFKDLKNVLFPTVHLRYDFTETSQLQLSFSRRVTRPSFWNLNPFVNVADKQNLTMGNPNLGPEFTNNLELGWQYFVKNSTFMITGYYRQRTDLITRFTEMRQAVIDENGMIHYTLIDDEEYIIPAATDFGTDTLTYTLTYNKNISRSHNFGFELVYGQKLFKVWRITLSADFYRVMYEADEVIDPNLLNDWAGGVRLNQTLNLPKNWDLQLNFRFRSPSLTIGSMGWGSGGIGQGKREAQYSLNLGVKKSFLNKTLTVGLNIRNLITNVAMETISYDNQISNGYYSINTRYNSYLRTNLTITYKLNNYKRQQMNNMDGSDDGMEMMGE